MNLAYSRETVILLLTLAAPILSADTAVREYIAPMHDSLWLASEEKGECLLQHDIPGFGSTKLSQSRREPLSFELHITQDVALGTQCQVAISPPPWRHGISSQSLGTIKIVPGAEHIQAKGGAAQKIYQGLEAGMMASFDCTQAGAPLSQVRVVISPVRYLVALPDFQRCVASLASKKKVASKPTKKGVKKKVAAKSVKKPKKK
jgi:hypothetical protein